MSNPNFTAQQKIESAIAIVNAIEEAIQQMGAIETSKLYTILMPKMSYNQFNAIKNALINTDKIHEKNNILYWYGE